MKKIISFSLFTMLILPAMAGTTRTTTTRSYESTSSSPVMGTDMEMNSELDSDADMIEAQEEYEGFDEQEHMEEQERMEDTSYTETEDRMDYQDRTRTERARKALNTGSNASDDQ